VVSGIRTIGDLIVQANPGPRPLPLGQRTVGNPASQGVLGAFRRI